MEYNYYKKLVKVNDDVEYKDLVKLGLAPELDVMF